MKKNLLLKRICVASAAMVVLPFSQLAMAEKGKANVNISGWINEGVTFFDDGDSSDIAQLSDNGTTLGSRLTFSGDYEPAKLNLKAGFEVILQPQSNVTPLISANQDNLDTAFGGDISALSHNLFVSGDWGKITVGLQSLPTDNIAVLGDPSGSIFSGISPVFRGNGFFIRGLGAGGENIVWGNFLNCLGSNILTGVAGIGIDCNGIYRNGVRYDLPQLGPFNVAVGYANDDIYDVALKYNQDFGSLKTIFHAGYSRNADGGAVVGGNGSDTLQFQGGLLDSKTGLFGTVALQFEQADNSDAGTGDDTDAIYIKAGIKKNWLGFGETQIYGEYASYNDQFGSIEGVTGSEVERIGIVLDQKFGDRLLIYAKLEQYSLDVDGDANAQAIFGGAEDLTLGTLGLAVFF